MDAVHWTAVRWRPVLGQGFGHCLRPLMPTNLNSVRSPTQTNLFLLFAGGPSLCGFYKQRGGTKSLHLGDLQSRHGVEWRPAIPPSVLGPSPRETSPLGGSGPGGPGPVAGNGPGWPALHAAHERRGPEAHGGGRQRPPISFTRSTRGSRPPVPGRSTQARPVESHVHSTLPGEEGRSSGWPRARSCRRVRVDSELEARRRSSAACSHQYALPAGCRLAGGPARRSRLLDCRPAGRRPGPSSALFGLFKFFRIGTVPIGLAVAVDLALHRIVWPTASTPPSV